MLDFYSISRSHLYWGRKPITGLMKILRNLEPIDLFLDPFCGAGTSSATALHLGARILVSDLNPIAVFLTKVLIQPISLFSLEQSLETLRDEVAESILSNYAILCPGCRKEVYFDYLKWNCLEGNDMPEAVKVTCKHCGFNGLHPLTKDETKRQIAYSELQPRYWFPRNRIRTQRKTKASFFYELFTGRNLAMLTELYHAIEKISSPRCRDVFNYVFTGMLYSCSSMQMFSSKSPSSSRGWTAPRFYLPSARKEKNVWKTFETRFFKTVLPCKERLNSSFGSLRISNSLQEFENSNDAAYVHQADFLSFPFPKKLRLSHIFLDPPYNDDVDYLGFSEFWSSWLHLKSPEQAGWNPGKMTNEQNADQMRKLLQRIRNNTDHSCKIILAYGSKRQNAWEFMKSAISDVGYKFQDLGPIYLDNPQKRKPHEFTVTDRYFLLTRDLTKPAFFRPAQEQPHLIRLKTELNELYFFIRLAAFLLHPELSTGQIPSADRIREKTNYLIMPHLREELNKIKKREVLKLVSDIGLNQKAYNRLCLSLLNLILSKDGFRITEAAKNRFDDSELRAYTNTQSLPQPQGIAEGVDFVAEDREGKKILFCFYNEEKISLLKDIANKVTERDSNEFQILHFLIFHSHEDMYKYRQLEYQDKWPRGFFITFDELTRRAIELDKDAFRHLQPLSERSKTDYRSLKKIDSFKAKVTENRPVRDDGNCKHFRIKFEAPQLKYILPGQFVMIDTVPIRERKKAKKKIMAPLRKYPSISKIVDLGPRSFLKRPFSIHRAFYEGFGYGYLKNIELPQNLAPITHTIFPNRFEIFYKVLDNGVGTNELTKVKKGSKIEVLGPLGTLTDLSKWRMEGIQEVHLVGGGVGMAPLIFFGQALKFYSFKLKAFIGIDKIESLKYSAPFAPSFAEDPENAYVYVENLLGIGLSLDDIYVSSEESFDTTNWRVPEKNCHTGFVPAQYESFLQGQACPDQIMILSCGPKPMLRAMAQIALKHSIPMKVLLEKRMACGIGVCMSCVCKIKTDGSKQYSRVCIDGPLFDASKIEWD
jgi:dihydroorotate dehydrogenase electron transfer subunit